MDLSQLTQLSERYSKSYQQQKIFIKKVLQGKLQQCPACGQQLNIDLGEKGNQGAICCEKGCTDIMFER